MRDGILSVTFLDEEFTEDRFMDNSKRYSHTESKGAMLRVRFMGEPRTLLVSTDRGAQALRELVR